MKNLNKRGTIICILIFTLSIFGLIKLLEFVVSKSDETLKIDTCPVTTKIGNLTSSGWRSSQNPVILCNNKENGSVLRFDNFATDGNCVCPVDNRTANFEIIKDIAGCQFYFEKLIYIKNGSNFITCNNKFKVWVTIDGSLVYNVALHMSYKQIYSECNIGDEINKELAKLELFASDMVEFGIVSLLKTLRLTSNPNENESGNRNNNGIHNLNFSSSSHLDFTKNLADKMDILSKYCSV